MFLFAILSVLLAAHALPLNSPLLDSYDYIVVGGGPGGLTVANRLSEDPSINVLLLEAGAADQGEAEITVPGYIGQAIGSRYDWNLSTVPQTYLDGKMRSLPQGRGLGGGTLINGMLWNRGGQGDYEDWVALGNEGWAWNDLLPYFRKSETYTPLSLVELAEQFSIEEDQSAHGLSGPVNVSYPRYFWNSSGMLFGALNELGVPTAYDPSNGLIASASFLPLSLDPSNESRSTARRAYYDPVVERPNLWISTGQHVTQILFANGASNTDATTSTPEDHSVGQGFSPEAGGIYGWTSPVNVTYRSVPDKSAGPNSPRQLWRRLKGSITSRQVLMQSPPSDLGAETLVAIGVEYAADAQSLRRTVAATREVIISTGALHSPQLLMLSGIGPAAALDSLDIPVNLDLRGVGSNLQDHAQSWCWFQYTNSSFPNPMTENYSAAETEYWTNRTGPLTTNVVDGVAFPPLPLIVNGSMAVANQAQAQSADQYLRTGTDSTVIAGFAAQQALMVAALTDITRASYEILNANDGVLAVGGMRPLSRGIVTINSSKPFDPPVVDPRYGSNPVDLQVLLAAMRFNERLVRTDSMAPLEPMQVSPASGLSDADLLTYLRNNLQTEYHVGGTCAMLPRALGGVVDSSLLVYGTSNVRVVDASIMPMLPAGHLQAVVYGIAEKAADIIKSAASSNMTRPAPVDSTTISAGKSAPLCMVSLPESSGSSASSDSAFLQTTTDETKSSTYPSSTSTRIAASTTSELSRSPATATNITTPATTSSPVVTTFVTVVVTRTVLA